MAIVKMRISEYRSRVEAAGVKPEDPRTIRRKIEDDELPGVKEGARYFLYVDTDTNLTVWPADAAVKSIKPVNSLAAKLLERQGIHA